MCLELFGDVATPYVMLFYLVSSCFTQLIGIPLVRWSGEAGGFSMQSTDKGKAQFSFEFTGHVSMSAQTVVPFEVYLKEGTEEA